MGFFGTILTTPARLKSLGHSNDIQISKKLVDSAHAEVATALTQLNTTSNGLKPEEIEARLEEYGPNVVAKEKRQTWLMRLWENIKNPLVILLVILGVISFLTGDMRATIVILTMVILVFRLDEGRQARARGGRTWRAVAAEAWGTDILADRSFVFLVASRFFILGARPSCWPSWSVARLV